MREKDTKQETSYRTKRAKKYKKNIETCNNVFKEKNIIPYTYCISAETVQGNQMIEINSYTRQKEQALLLLLTWIR